MSFNSCLKIEIFSLYTNQVLFSSFHVSDRQAAAFYSCYPGCTSAVPVVFMSERPDVFMSERCWDQLTETRSAPYSIIHDIIHTKD